MVAHYEYSPFGVPTLATGTYAATNPFRFSSEYHDPETNLVYYNYRYYSPALGRWLSRDPIGEKGGRNLYIFTYNQPLNHWDIQGNEVNEKGVRDPGSNYTVGRGVGKDGKMLTGLFNFLEDYIPGMHLFGEDHDQLLDMSEPYMPSWCPANSIWNPINIPTMPIMFTGGAINTAGIVAGKAMQPGGIIHDGLEKIGNAITNAAQKIKSWL